MKASAIGRKANIGAALKEHIVATVTGLGEHVGDLIEARRSPIGGHVELVRIHVPNHRPGLPEHGIGDSDGIGLKANGRRITGARERVLRSAPGHIQPVIRYGEAAPRIGRN